MRRAAAAAVVLLAACGGGDGRAAVELCDALAAEPLGEDAPEGIRVFFEPGTDEDVIFDARDELEDLLPGLEFTYMDQDAALEEFSELFADQPELVDSITAAELPPSLNALDATHDEARIVEEAMDDHRSVQEVARPPAEREVATVADLMTAPVLAPPLGYDVVVYLEPSASDDDAAELAAEVAEWPGVVDVVTLTHDDALAEFGVLFQDDKDLVNSTDADVLPPSVRLTLEDAGDSDAISEELAGRSEVREVNTQKDSVEALRSFGLDLAAARARWTDAVDAAGHPVREGVAEEVIDAADALAPLAARVVDAFGDGVPDRVVGPGAAIGADEWARARADAIVLLAYAHESCAIHPEFGSS